MERLRQLPLSDIIEFHRTLEALHAESLRADLWDAAAVINQWDSSDRLFCSEDRFFISGAGWWPRAARSTRPPSPTQTP